MKKQEIRKVHEKAVGHHMRQAINDHAKYEAHSRVSEALAESHGKESPRAPEGSERTSEHSTEHARKTGTRVIPGHAVEGHLGHGSGKA